VSFLFSYSFKNVYSYIYILNLYIKIKVLSTVFYYHIKNIRKYALFEKKLEKFALMLDVEIFKFLKNTILYTALNTGHISTKSISSGRMYL